MCQVGTVHGAPRLRSIGRGGRVGHRLVGWRVSVSLLAICLSVDFLVGCRAGWSVLLSAGRLIGWFV